MKKIKICMIHHTNNVNDLYYSLHIPKGKCEYEFIWDEDEPDYLIASEHIYYYKNAWDKFVKLYPKAKIRLFYCGECIDPDLNIFDYAISFSRKNRSGDRITRIPSRVFYDRLILKRKNPLENKYDEALLEYEKRKKFCDFIYSNPNAHSERKRLFDTISCYYRTIDSYGKYLNNVSEYRGATKDFADMMLQNYKIRSNYRFSIACENAKYSGYTSEKIYSALCSNTVPIYWGNPLIYLDVNPDVFVNAMDFDNYDSLIDEISKIDNSAEIWASKVASPWLTAEQETKEKLDYEEYKSSIDNIFLQPIEAAKRIAEGFHPEWYRKWFWEY